MESVAFLVMIVWVTFVLIEGYKDQHKDSPNNNHF